MSLVFKKVFFALKAAFEMNELHKFVLSLMIMFSRMTWDDPLGILSFNRRRTSDCLYK